jgi:hypothetical protein
MHIQLPLALPWADLKETGVQSNYSNANSTFLKNAAEIAG